MGPWRELQDGGGGQVRDGRMQSSTVDLPIDPGALAVGGVGLALRRESWPRDLGGGGPQMDRRGRKSKGQGYTCNLEEGLPASLPATCSPGARLGAIPGTEP